MAGKKRKSTTGRSKRKGAQRGRGVKDVIRKVLSYAKPVHSIVKSHKFVSRALRHTGYAKAANIADQLGYGVRKRKSRASKGVLIRIPGVRVARVPRVRSRRTLSGRGDMNSLRMRALYPAGQVGNGIFGKIGGALLSNFLPF